MSNKHVFESADGLVLASLRGFVSQNPSLRLHAPTKTVYLAHPPSSSTQSPTIGRTRTRMQRIAVVSGGGAGHEPAHAGYVGHGMLASAVSGDVFASPSAQQILAAIEFAAFAGLESDDAGQGVSDGAENGPEEGSATRNGASARKNKKGRDVAIVINNYTGDRLNFGLAIEQARARYPGLNVISVLNADDVSLLPHMRGDGGGGETADSGAADLVGPRGLAGNILVCKVLGSYVAFGAKGASTPATFPGPTLERTKLLGDALVAHLRSIGATLGHCHVPGRQPHSASELIGDSQIEIGLGLHNEPGVRRVSLTSLEWLIGEMVSAIRDSGGGWRGSDIYVEQNFRYEANEAWIRPGDETVLFINNLGGISALEMGAIVEQVLKELASHGIMPARIYSAAYMTSLNAPGFSVSLVNVTRIEGIVNADSVAEPIDLLALLDAPTEAMSWVGVKSWPTRFDSIPSVQEAEEEAENSLRSIHSSFRPHVSDASSVREDHPTKGYTWTNLGFSAEEITRGIRGASQSVFAAEMDMTRFDTVVGDGDCGHTFASGAKGIIEALERDELDPRSLGPASLVAKVGEILEKTMGGTIGALFAIFFTAWSTALRRERNVVENGFLSPSRPLEDALAALGKHTPARPGDRTVVDALVPLCESVMHATGTSAMRDAELEAVVRAVKKGAESTRGMRARLGRASYVTVGNGNGESTGVPPDPGAWGVAAVVQGFVDGVRGVSP